MSDSLIVIQTLVLSVLRNAHHPSWTSAPCSHTLLGVSCKCPPLTLLQLTTQHPQINRTPATTKMECLLSLMDVRDLLATLGHEYNYPHFRPMLRDVEPTCMPIDYRHAFLMMPETVFRYVVNIRLISYHSDLDPFSPLRPPSPILNVGSVVSRPSWPTILSSSSSFICLISVHSCLAHFNHSCGVPCQARNYTRNYRMATFYCWMVCTLTLLFCSCSCLSIFFNVKMVRPKPVLVRPSLTCHE